MKLGQSQTVSVRQFLRLAPRGLVLRDEDGDEYSFDGLNYVIKLTLGGKCNLTVDWAEFTQDEEPVTAEEFTTYMGTDEFFRYLHTTPSNGRYLSMEVVKAPLNMKRR